MALPQQLRDRVGSAFCGGELPDEREESGEKRLVGERRVRAEAAPLAARQ